MEELVEKSIEVYDGMKITYSQNSNESHLNGISELLPKFNGCYSVNNSTVAFIYEYQCYVIPFIRIVENTLRANEVQRAYFDVPFSNYSYPKAERVKWERLLAEYKKSKEEDFVEECGKYCDRQDIGKISEQALANCFVMPEKGVKVKHSHYEAKYFPIAEQVMNCTLFVSLGYYCKNNGRVVFVYRDGKTYVTKGYKIVSELKEAGYREKGLFVPFSNGEEIVDDTLKAKWNKIVKR